MLGKGFRSSAAWGKTDEYIYYFSARRVQWSRRLGMVERVKMAREDGMV